MYLCQNLYEIMSEILCRSRKYAISTVFLLFFFSIENCFENLNLRYSHIAGVQYVSLLNFEGSELAYFLQKVSIYKCHWPFG